MPGTEIQEQYKRQPIWDSFNERAGQLCDMWDRTEKIKRIAYGILLIAALALLVVGFPYLAVPLFITGLIVLGVLALTACLAFRITDKMLRGKSAALRKDMENSIQKPTTTEDQCRIVDIHLKAPLEGWGAFRCPYLVPDSLQKKTPDKLPYQG